MRLNEMLAYQEDWLRDAVLDTHNNGFYGDWDEIAKRRVSVLFAQLSAGAKATLLRFITTTYAIYEEDCPAYFGEHWKAIRNSGLLMRCPRTSAIESTTYAVPDEFVVALTNPSQLAHILVQMTSAELKQLKPVGAKGDSKYRLIAAALHDQSIVQANIPAKAGHVREALGMLGPLVQVIELPFRKNRAAWVSALSADQPQGTQRSWQYSDPQYIAKYLRTKLGPLFTHRVLFLAVDGGDVTIYWHPNYRAVVRQELHAAALEQQRSILEGPEPDIKPQQIELQIDRSDFERRCLALVAWHSAGFITRTSNHEWRVKDLKQCRIWMGYGKEDKGEDARTKTILDLLVHQAYSKSGGSVKGMRKALRDIAVNISHAKFIETFLASHHSQGAAVHALLDAVVQKLKTGRWYNGEQLVALVRSEQQLSDRPSVSVRNEHIFFAWYEHAVFKLQLDLAVVRYDGGGGIQAFRLVAPPLERPAVQASSKLILLPNFELPITPDIDRELLFDAYAFFSVKNINTLLVDRAMVLRLADKGHNAAEICAAIGKYLRHELPPNVQRFISEHVANVERVTAISSALVLYPDDSASIPNIRKVLKDTKHVVLDNRLVVVQAYSSESIIERLKRNGIMVKRYEGQAGIAGDFE